MGIERDGVAMAPLTTDEAYSLMKQERELCALDFDMLPWHVMSDAAMRRMAARRPRTISRRSMGEHAPDDARKRMQRVLRTGVTTWAEKAEQATRLVEAMAQEDRR